MTFRALAFAAGLLTLATPAFALDNTAPDPGAGDCYNRVSQTCARKHPGKTSGDAGYDKCITDGLNWCDRMEPAMTRAPMTVGVFNGLPGAVADNGPFNARPMVGGPSKVKRPLTR